MKNILPKTSLFAVTAIALTCDSGQSAILAYEGFNYGTAAASRAGADLLDGQADGLGGDIDATGLGGQWTDSSGPGSTGDNLFLTTNSLSFGDLVTSGNHVRSDTNSNNDNFSRSITASLNSGSELWFSVLANKLQNNFDAAEGGLVIGNQQVNNSRVLLDTGSSGLNGFGVAPTTNGNNWTAYGWNGSSQVVGGSALGVATNGSETVMLIGKIEFGGGTAGNDLYTLYNYGLNAGSVVGGSLNMITSIDVNIDESALDTMSLTRQVNTAYDEIRIGANLDDVIGVVPEPSSLSLLGLGGLALLRRRR